MDPIEQAAAIFIMHGSSLTQMVIEINVFISVSKSVLFYFILQGILMLQDFLGSVPEIPDQNYLTDLC